MSDTTPLSIAALKPPLNIQYITTVDNLQLVKTFLESVDSFTIDLETNVTDKFVDRKIRLIQVGDRNQQFVIDLLYFAGSEEALKEQGNRVAPEWAKPVVDLLRPYLDSNTKLKIGVNLSFEYTQLVWCLGVYPWHLYDCMMVEKCIWAGAVGFFTPGFYSMDGMVGRYAKLSVDKTHQTSFNLSDKLSQEQIEYAALDCRLPYAIKAGQHGLITSRKLERVVQIENDAIPAFCDLHMNGFFISRDRWMDQVRKYEQKHRENVKALDTYFCSVVGTKKKPKIDLDSIENLWREEKDKEKRKKYLEEFRAERRRVKAWEKDSETWEGDAAINYASSQQLIEALRKMGFGKKVLPNTSDDTLKKLEGSHPVIKALTNYRETAKVLSTYGEDFLAKYVTEQDRVHSYINQYGAETGRTSSSKPNIQNIPRGSAWRSCFIAPPGRKILTVDYNGCELRILAELSGEKVWIDAFNKGWDVHSVGAELLFGDEWKNAATAQCAYYGNDAHQKCDKKLCPKHAALRDKIKAINFGIAYGMEAKKLGNDLGITKEEAQKLLDTYRATFKKVTEYLKKSGELVKMSLVCRTMSGRTRMFQKPTWDVARARAIQSADKYGREFQESDVAKTYYAMFGAIEREGKNTPIQGSNADLMKLAMGCGFDSEGKPFLWHKLREVDVMLVNMVHDELVAESGEDCAQAGYELIGDCMIRSGKEFVKSVVMEYDGHVDDEWSK